MSGRMTEGVATEQSDASFGSGRHAGTAVSPSLPPKLFLADSGVSGGSPVPVVRAVMSPTSTLQAAAAGSPTSPAATAAPFSRHGASPSSPSSSGSGDSHRRKSKISRGSHRPAWEWEARPAGLGLAGALNGDDAAPPAAATTVRRGQRFRSPGVASNYCSSSSPGGRWCRLMSPREMEASEDYTRVIDRGGPNPRTTHIFGGGRVVVDGESFLRWCHGCSKDLGQGKDIFMYRGEMAFCSHECRYREMLLLDEES